jgi:hypothetical protein
MHQSIHGNDRKDTRWEPLEKIHLDKWNGMEVVRDKISQLLQEGLAADLCLVSIVCRSYEKKPDFAGPPRERPCTHRSIPPKNCLVLSVKPLSVMPICVLSTLPTQTHAMLHTAILPRSRRACSTARSTQTVFECVLHDGTDVWVLDEWDYLEDEHAMTMLSCNVHALFTHKHRRSVLVLLLLIYNRDASTFGTIDKYGGTVPVPFCNGTYDAGVSYKYHWKVQPKHVSGLKFDALRICAPANDRPVWLEPLRKLLHCLSPQGSANVSKYQQTSANVSKCQQMSAHTKIFSTQCDKSIAPK